MCVPAAAILQLFTAHHALATVLLLQEDWITEQQEGIMRYWKEAQDNITAAGLTLRDLQHAADMVSGGQFSSCCFQDHPPCGLQSYAAVWQNWATQHVFSVPATPDCIMGLCLQISTRGFHGARGAHTEMIPLLDLANHENLW
jgi:hypothetical protein